MPLPGLAHRVADLPAGVVELGRRPVGGAPAADHEHPLPREVLRPVVVAVHAGQLFPRDPEPPQDAALPRGVDEIAAGVAALLPVPGILERLRHRGRPRAQGPQPAVPSGDVPRRQQEPLLVRLDALDALVGAYAGFLSEAPGNRPVVVDEVALDNQVVDVEVDGPLLDVLRQGMEGELHPLPRREGQQVFRDLVPQPAHLLLGYQQVVEGGAAAELHGDLLEVLEQLSGVVEDAEQIDGGQLRGKPAKIHSQQGSPGPAQEIAQLGIPLPQDRTLPEMRMPAAEHHGQRQTGRPSADDDGGVVFRWRCVHARKAGSGFGVAGSSRFQGIRPGTTVSPQLRGIQQIRGGLPGNSPPL